MTIQALSERFPDLCSALPQFERQSSLSLTAGLFLNPTFQANHIRIEALAHLVLAYANGNRIPDHRNLRSWIRSLSDEAFIAAEDPAEDVLATSLCWEDGDRQALLGAQPSADFWLRCLLEATNDIPVGGEFGRVRTSVRTLLRLSDAALRLGQTPIEVMGRNEPGKSILSLPSKATISILSEAVSFNCDRLNALSIDVNDLEDLVYDVEQSPTILTASYESSPLHVHPVVRFGANYVLALPSTVISAARERILATIGATQNLENLSTRIRRIQIRELDSALSRLHCNSLDEDGLVLPHLDMVPCTVRRFDTDKALICALVMQPERSADAISPSAARLTNAINATILEATRFLSIKHKLFGGLIIVAGGGWGDPMSLELSAPPANWFYELLSVPEFVTMSFGRRSTIMRFWRYARDRDSFQRAGNKLVAVGGELSAYGYWSNQRFSFLHDRADPGKPTVIMADATFATVERAEARSRRKLHSAFHPILNRWLTVERFSFDAYFPKDQAQPFYVHVDRRRSDQYLACVEASPGTIWIETSRPNSESRIPIVYNLWKSVCEWCLLIAPWLDTNVASLARTIVVQLEFEKLNEWAIALAPRNPLPPLPLVTTVDRNTGTVHARLTERHFHSFADASNSADRCLVTALVHGIAEANGIACTSADAIAYMQRIVLNDAVRFFHLIPEQESLASLEGDHNPLLISAEAKSSSRRGVGSNLKGFVSGELNAIPQARNALFDAVDVLYKRIIGRLKPFSVESIVHKCLVNHREVDGERQSWRATSAALTAIHGREDARRVAVEQETDLALTGIGSRLVIEAALSGGIGGSVHLTDDALELCLADFAQLLELANHADAVMEGLAAPKLKLTIHGEIEYDSKFADEIVYAYQFDVLGNRFLDNAAGYAALFPLTEKAESASDPDLAGFLAAWDAEYPFSVDHLRKAVRVVCDESTSHPSNIFVCLRSRLLQIIENGAQITSACAASLIDELRLWPRPGFDVHLPKGYGKSEVYPWVYRRRMSAYWRPLIQIDERTDPTFVLSRDLIARSTQHRLGSLFAGSLPAERFTSELMKTHIGRAAVRRGSKFNDMVQQEISRFGLWARKEIELTTLGAPATGDDGRAWGDVDVLAIDDRLRLVHVIECKALMEARSVREIIDQLKAFQGERDDYLGKHLRRFEWIRNNLVLMSTKLDRPLTGFRIKNWVITSKVVPMRYRTGYEVGHDRFIHFEELSQALRLNSVV